MLEIEDYKIDFKESLTMLDSLEIAKQGGVENPFAIANKKDFEIETDQQAIFIKTLIANLKVSIKKITRNDQEVSIEDFINNESKEIVFEVFEKIFLKQFEISYKKKLQFKNTKKQS